MTTEFSLDRPLGELLPDLGHEWRCPVCDAALRHEYRPGRKRVYCSDACKQRAYRWRRRNGVRVLATPGHPAHRSRAGRTHAVRPAVDFVGAVDDEQRRRVAVCGAFARVAHPSHHGHTEFVPGSATACKSCTRLIGADPAWHDEYPITVAAPPPEYIRYRPPDERWAQYLADSSVRAA
jgi:hypothetical protein